MKIDAPKSTSGNRSIKNLKATRSTSQFTDVLNSSHVDQTEAKAPPMQVLSANDILSIQEKAQSSPRERGEKMLEALDRLHADMVMGQPSVQNLHEMARTLNEKMNTSDNPKLQSILNQVEQRVAIELAKRGRY